MNNNIKKLRKALGLTMVQLAEKIGTSQQQVDRLEKGKRKLSAEWIDMLCKALSCKPWELVDFTVDEITRGSSVIVASANVIGAIEPAFGNNVRELAEDERYEIRFRPARTDLGKEFFALVVEGGNYVGFGAGTELIFAVEHSHTQQQGLAENKASFNTTQPTNLHKFSLAGQAVEARLLKSIRSE